MAAFIDRINQGDVLVADGATGTNLHAMGLKAGTPPEDLVMEQPEQLLELANRFVDAGSDIILTCTFGGTSLRMKESKYGQQAAEVNRRAAGIARQAAREGRRSYGGRVNGSHRVTDETLWSPGTRAGPRMPMKNRPGRWLKEESICW